MLLPLLAAITLSASSATSRAVTLVWSGATGAVTVERKAAGTPWPTQPPVAPLATVPAATYTDQAIDAFATYTYRVKAGAVVSNEITVGPPPVGLSQVHPMPAKLRTTNLGSFGALTRLTFDANGDPLVAYLITDPNGDGDNGDGQLWTISWNRARYQWNDGVKVDDVGTVPSAGSNIPFSIARDAASGTIGLFYIVGDSHELRFATSADASSWTSAVVRRTNAEAPSVASPALAMSASRVHVAYTVGPDTLVYLTGGVTAAPSAWRPTVAPHPGDSKRYTASCVSLALDAANAALVSFCTPPEDGYTTSAWVWRVGGAAAKVTDTNTHQTDDPSLSIALQGATVAALFGAARDDRFFSDHHFWASVSRDGGRTWSAAEAIADDGGHAMAAPAGIVVHTNQSLSAITVVNGGTEGKNRCGQPKLARSATGTGWVTCAPDTRGAPDTSNPGAASIGVAGNDKLYVVFRAAGAVGPVPPGLVLWRER
jgi:hypothetical protein